MARISAHETVLGQAASTAALMVSITSKPLSESTFATASFSDSKLPSAGSSNKSDPSHPCKNRPDGNNFQMCFNL